MSADSGQLRVIAAQNEQLLTELGQVLGAVATLAEVLEKLLGGAEVANGRGQQGKLLRLAPRSDR
jgi:hypothetical protein